VAGLLLLHLGTRSTRTARRILALALASAVFGLVFDSLLIVFGVYEPVRWIVPHPFATIWLLALWVNFALIADIPLRWLQRHLFLAAVCGGIFGPTAYLTAERLEVIEIGRPTTACTVALVVAWALGLAIFMFLARVIPDFAPTGVLGGDAEGGASSGAA
jgi:hypothetical protein